MWWAVRAITPYMTTMTDRAIALWRRVHPRGLGAEQIRRFLVKGAVFTIILVVWNGRRIANAVIVPIWA